MKLVRTFIFIVLVGFVTIPGVAFVVLWIEAAAAISNAEHSGVLRASQADTKLTMAERAIVVTEFRRSWNARSAPCRPVANLWTATTRPGVRVSGSSVSTALSTVILMEGEHERFLHWQFKRVFAACQLEQRYSDTQMLRAWLSNAYFGARPYGIESAAQSLFGKTPPTLMSGRAHGLQLCCGRRVFEMIRNDGMNGRD